MRAANRHHQTLLPLMAGGAGGLVRNGLVAEYRFDESRNLLKYSQQFDNAAWTKAATYTVTPNDIVAPDGTITADKLLSSDSASCFIFQTVTVVPGAIYTFSFWVKNGDAATTKYAIYDATNAGWITAATEYPLSSEWVRHSYSFTSPVGCVSVRVYISRATTTGKYVYIWGAQLEPGSVARTYYPTTDKQLLMDYSRPRKNLLLPNQANACEDGTVPFTKLTAGDAVTASAGEVDEWQGTYCAKVDTANAAANEGIYTTDIIYNLKPSTTYTASGYIRGAAGGETVKLGLRETTDAGATVDTTGSDTLTLTTGWQRVTVSRTFGTTGRGAMLLVYTPTQQNIVFYVDGLQLEEGATATAWEAPPNIGISGSTTGADTNDPTYTGEGASFTTDDSIVCPTTVEGGNNNRQFTIIAVINYPDTPSDYGVIAGKVRLNAHEWGLRTSNNSTDTLLTVRGEGGSVTATIPNTSIKVGAYCCVTGTFSSDLKPRMYLGSTLMNTGSALSGTVNTVADSFYIGRRCNTSNAYFNGTVSYIIVYNRALTQAEISQNYAYLKSYLLRERGISI
jgi:hypothetical protein